MLLSQMVSIFAELSDSHKQSDGKICLASTPRFPTLPPEIIDNIISFLWDQPRTLCKCALTCRGWRPASQHYLLDHIKVTSRSQLNLFAHRVLHEPHMRASLHSVRSLMVVESHDEPFADVIPHYFVGHFTRLKSIAFVSVNWTDRHSYRPTFFMTLSAFASVTTLCLCRCQFNSVHELKRLVSAFPQLIALEIIEQLPWNHSPDSPDSGVVSELRRPQLRALTLLTPIQYFSICTWLLRTLSATSITHLVIQDQRRISLADLLLLQKLIHSLGRSLVHLVVPLFDSFDEVITLVHNTNLRSLSMFNFPSISGDWMRLASIMSQLTSRLRWLKIMRGVEYAHYESEEAERRKHMSAFDIAMGRENFGDLERVELALVIQDVGNSKAACDQVLRDTQRGLAGIHARGILSVDVRSLISPRDMKIMI